MQTYYTYKGQPVRETLEAIDLPPDVERVVLLGQSRPVAHEMLEILNDRGCRTIAVDTTIATDQTDYVGFDNQVAMKIAIDYLTGLGHRRVAFLVSEPEKADDVVLRRLYPEQICDSAGLDWSVFSCNTEFFESAHEAAYSAMPKLWQAETKPTAILTVSDAGAWAALKWLAEQGVKVPDQVSVPSTLWNS